MFQPNGGGNKKNDDLDRVNLAIDLEELHPFRGERMAKIMVKARQVREDNQVEDIDSPGYFTIAGGESAPLIERTTNWVAGAKWPASPVPPQRSFASCPI